MNTTIHTAETSPEPEQHPRLEQRKFIPETDDAVAYSQHALQTVTAIEQMYLSHPEEPFSLRMRRYGLTCSALIETRRLPEQASKEPVVIETEIDEKAFTYYAMRNYPSIEKLRAETSPGVTIDQFRHHESRLPQASLPLIEITPVSERTEQLPRLGFREVTTDISYWNETMAHQLNPAESSRLTSPENPPNPIEITDGILHQLTNNPEKPYVLAVSGRSGSGKTTIAKQVSQQLREHEIDVAHISTDDYHRGKRWLLDTFGVTEWKNWDADVVYNTGLLAWELEEHLKNGEPMPKRSFNFSTEEPERAPDDHDPAQVIIVEGLYPHAEALQPLLDRRIDMPTPLATSIGRRILRDIGGRLNDSLGSAESILRYQLETAEPTYRNNQ